MTYTMTTAEAAAKLGYSMRRVQALAKSRRLRAIKRGRDYFFDPESVAGFRPLPEGRPKKNSDAPASR